MFVGQISDDGSDSSWMKVPSSPCSDMLWKMLNFNHFTHFVLNCQSSLDSTLQYKHIL